MALLRYEYSPMFAGGIAAHDFTSLLPEVLQARDKLLSRQAELGFLQTPGAREVAEIQKLARKSRKTFDTLLLIGIGGSDLGTRAIYQALIGESMRGKKGMKLVFLGNTDPEEAFDTLSGVNWKRTLVNVVSKSGETAEILANFFLARKLLEKSLGVKRAQSQIVATTDPATGLLSRLSGENKWATLPIPANIGGRFSALTAVGLFPVACAGLKVASLLSGARKILLSEKNADGFTPAGAYAALSALAYKKGRTISVFMPYTASLLQLAVWYRQLWAESLGKKETAGPTPVAALGAVDQHSQLQLYQEGPNDKLITFLEVERFRKNLQVPTLFRERRGALAVQGHSFESIIHAERQATAAALSSAGKPNGTLFIPKISEETIGALLQFFMMSVSYLGALLKINAFDQPGVEEMKKNLIGLLAGGVGKTAGGKGERAVSY